MRFPKLQLFYLTVNTGSLEQVALCVFFFPLETHQCCFASLKILSVSTAPTPPPPPFFFFYIVFIFGGGVAPIFGIMIISDPPPPLLVLLLFPLFES